MTRFYFTTQVMMPHPEWPERLSSRGNWLPPKMNGANVTYGDALHFHYQAHRSPVPTLNLQSGFPVELERVQTFSLYYAREKIWMIDYDATAGRVGDGLHDPNDPQDEEPDNSEEDKFSNWTELTFEQRGNHMVAFAGMWRELTKLPIRRPDQVWAQELLPRRYRAERRTENQRYGGMIGDIPVLIGLAALSVHPTHVRELLPRIMVNPGQGGGWQAIPASQNPQHPGWLNQRGLLVSVYLDPWGSDETELEQFAHGAYGPIFT